LSTGSGLVCFDPSRAHFFGHCANLRRDEPVGREDLGSAVDAQLVDEQPEERFGFARVGFCDDGFEVVGDRSEFGGRERTCGLVRRLKGERPPWSGTLGLRASPFRERLFARCE